MTEKVRFVGGHGHQGVRSNLGSSDVPPVAFGYVMAAGAAGAEGILTSPGLRMSFGMINMGTFFQSDVDCKVSFTLHPDPEHADDVLWGNEISITPGDIKSTPLAYTAMKVVFGSTGGALYIASL